MDSNGRPGAGIMEGNVMRLGDFHECLAIQVPRPGKADYVAKQCFKVSF